MSLYDKMLAAINSKAVVQNKGTGDVYAAKACEKVAIELLLDLLKTLLASIDDPESIEGVSDLMKKLESKLKES